MTQQARFRYGLRDYGYKPKKETKTMTQHTPGPWTVTLSAGTRYIEPTEPMDGSESIARIDPFNQHDEANARLIASAPEMLAALKATLQALEAHLDSDTLHSGLKHRDQLCPCNQIEVANARALLAKIEGGK